MSHAFSIWPGGDSGVLENKTIWISLRLDK
jgi:hypothetical protein